MNTVRNVATSTAALAASNIVAGALTFFTNIVIARLLGAEVLGGYAFVIAFLSFFTVVANLGLDVILVRELAVGKERSSLIGTTILLKILSGIVAVIFAAVIIFFLDTSIEIKKAVLLASGTLLLQSLGNTGMGLLQSRIELLKYAYSSIFSRVITFLLMLLIAFKHGSLLQLASTLVIGALIHVVLLMYYCREEFMHHISASFSSAKEMLKESWPIAMTGIFISMYFRIDVVMISFFRKTSDIGHYAAAYTLSEAPSIIAVAFMLSLFPIMSRVAKESNKTMSFVSSRSLKYMLILAVPVAIGATLLSSSIINFVYGSEYASSVAAFSILIWAGAMIMLNVVVNNILTTLGLQKINFYVTLVCLAANIMLNLVLIPKYGIVGAAIATVITEVIGFVASMIIALKKVALSIPILGIAISSIAMGALVFVLRYRISFLYVIPMAAVAYFILIAVFRSIDKEDIAIMKKIIGRGD